MDKKTVTTLSNGGLTKETRNKIQELEKGNITALDCPELIGSIAQHIFDLYNSGDMRQSLILLENLGAWSRSETVKYRERSLMALSLVTEKVLEQDNEDFLEALAGLLIRWLKNETEYVAGFEYICLQLLKLLGRMLHRGLWYQSEDLIIILSKIKNGDIKKSKIFTQVIAKIHSGLADEDFLKTLTHAYIANENERREIAGALLTHLGDKAASHLLLTLRDCPHKIERFHLIELIPAAGASIIPALVELLEKDPPWYVARNIILILSKLGDPSLFYLVRPFMAHDDIRVQQEVINCVRTLKGTKMVYRLLDVLEVCNDQLKPQVIRTLGNAKEKKIGKAFRDLLKNIEALDPKAQDSILQAICSHITSHPSQESIYALHNIISQKDALSSISPGTMAIAESTYIALQQNTSLSADNAKPAFTLNLDKDSPDPLTYKNGITTADNDDKNLPVDAQNTVEWLTVSIKNKDNPKHLRQHLFLRRDLYNQLSAEEFSAFSSCLTHKAYKKGETLVEAGDVHSHLFFIDSGEIDMVFPQDGSETYVRQLGEGDLFGNDVFMSGSEWEITLVSKTDTEIFIFDQENLLTIQRRFPELSKKILEYCKRRDVTLGLFRMLENGGGAGKVVEPAPFTWANDELVANIECTGISNSGFCFSFHLPQGTKHTQFADKSISAFFHLDVAERKEIEAQIIGLKFLANDNNKLHVLAKFHRQEDLSGFICSHVCLQQ